MGRKDLLKGLMDAAKGSDDPAPEVKSAAPPRRPAKGAIGAVSQSIEALKARSLIDIDPFLIDAGGLQDRLESDDAEDAALLASIRDYGQQVPILVRPHPSDPERYQIVYGRRRVLAHRDLNRPVKAMVRDLDDADLVMAQGQENTARRGLSFIEKANFAAQMRNAGYSRKTICDALSIDKTVVSRMLLIVDRIGLDLISNIGAAPNIGRDRWNHLANEMELRGTDPDTIIGVLNMIVESAKSDDRFEAAMSCVIGKGGRAGSSAKAPTATGQQPRQSRRKIQSANGFPIAAVLLNPEKVVLTIDRDHSGGFEDWLVENLEEIHSDWMASRREDTEQ